MNVDESRRDDEARRVDRACRRRRAKVAHLHDPVATDPDVGVEPRIAAAVEHAPVADDEVIARPLRGDRRRGGEERENRESCPHAAMNGGR